MLQTHWMKTSCMGNFDTSGRRMQTNTQDQNHGEETWHQLGCKHIKSQVFVEEDESTHFVGFVGRREPRCSK